MSVEVMAGRASDAGRRSANVCRAVICAFAATGILATNILLPSLPAIAAELRVSTAAVTSAITLFLAIVAVGQLIVGPLSDRVGRQRPILVGLCIFVLGTIGCALAADLSGLLIGRTIQAAGACTVTVLSRAVGRDLFDGGELTKVMAAITIATAAAPGFSPLLGGAIDHLFGWRFAFVFVAMFAACAGAAYLMFVGETMRATEQSLHPARIAASYLDLLRDARFRAPARTASLLMAGVFAVFSGAPRVLLEGHGLSPITLGSLFAGVVFLVLAAGIMAPKLSSRLGACDATLLGLGVATSGGVALLVSVLVLQSALLPFLVTASVFLVGIGIASPLTSAAALSPFASRAGLAAALFGFSQMGGAACGASFAAILFRDPAVGIGTVAALTSLLALFLHLWKGRPAGRVSDREAGR